MITGHGLSVAGDAAVGITALGRTLGDTGMV
jgi:hypothetical protein